MNINIFIGFARILPTGTFNPMLKRFASTTAAASKKLTQAEIVNQVGHVVATQRHSYFGIYFSSVFNYL